MSCPIPLRIINPHYKKVAFEYDEPVDNYSNRLDYYIDVPCGRCVNCRKAYKNAWRVRLHHEWMYMCPESKKRCYFVTLTFDDDHLPSDKESATKLIRRFLERVRRKYKKSVRHWLVSEYGSHTSRLHFHGILFDPPFQEWELGKFWKYGFVDSKLLTPKRISYVTTYINKLLTADIEDPDKRQWVFASPGLGKSYTQDPKVRFFSHHDGIPSPFGYFGTTPFALPRYYRVHLFDEFEREDMSFKYLMNTDTDVIPDPPYFIGHKKYTDYSLYLADADKLRQKYNQLYKPKKYGFNCK